MDVHEKCDLVFIDACPHHLQIGQKLPPFDHLRDRFSLFRQRPGWTDLYTFAAAGAGGGCTPGTIEIGDDPGIDPAVHYIPGVGSFDFVADADTAQAKHAPVVIQREPVVGSVNRQPGIEIFIPNMGNAESNSQILKFAMPVGNADRTDMIAFREQQLQDLPAILLYPLGVADHFHSFPGVGHAGGNQFRRARNLDKTQAAGASFGQAIEMAERRDKDIVLSGHGQDGLILPCTDILAIDFKGQNS